jgi:hypothetical protein
MTEKGIYLHMIFRKILNIFESLYSKTNSFYLFLIAVRVGKVGFE